MDWGPLASTCLGAAIGIATTLAADHLRARRSRADDDQSSRRQLYGDYLAALARTRNVLRMAARPTTPPTAPAEHTAHAAQAFHDSNAYELRYQIAVVAPREVVEASTAAFRALRDLKDHVEQGATVTDPAYTQARERWDRTLDELRMTMRRDLGRPVF